MIPRLRKQPEKKSCHGYNWIDDYLVHQDNCSEILRDPSKVNPEVRKYIESENAYTKDKWAIQKKFRKKFLRKLKVELNWMMKVYHIKIKSTNIGPKLRKKVTIQKLRRKIGDTKVETYWDGDQEAKGRSFLVQVIRGFI